MWRKLAFCTALSRQQAEEIMHRLESENFADSHISVIFPDRGALVVPGIGSFIAAGPIVASLNGATDSPTGELASGLVGLGLPGETAARCQREVEEGRFLLSVHALTTEEVGHAKKIFAEMGGRNICDPAEACPAASVAS